MLYFCFKALFSRGILLCKGYGCWAYLFGVKKAVVLPLRVLNLKRFTMLLWHPFSFRVLASKNSMTGYFDCIG